MNDAGKEDLIDDKFLKLRNNKIVTRNGKSDQTELEDTYSCYQPKQLDPIVSIVDIRKTIVDAGVKITVLNEKINKKLNETFQDS